MGVENLDSGPSASRPGAGTFTTFRATQKSSIGTGGSQWGGVLTPVLLFEDARTRDDDLKKLLGLSEGVYPVRRAESAFALLGRVDEFRTYYEQNRFGEMSIGPNGESKSSLSSLTGDDVSLGSDRVFFAKTLPHLAASVVGFSAVEAALEMGNFQDGTADAGVGGSGKMADDAASTTGSKANAVSSVGMTPSSKYERALIAELGTLIHTRSPGATLAEMARSSLLMVSLRSALRIVFPSSPTRRSDKELIAFDADIIMRGLQIAQEEQSKACSKLVKEERYEPMARPMRTRNSPLEEVLNYPFGLYESIQSSSLSRDIDNLDPTLRRNRTSAPIKETDMFTYSHSVPHIVRSIHERIITFAAFALGQQEVGQNFSAKKGGGLAAYVLDCVEECVAASAVAMRSGFDHMDELQVNQAVQILANIHALQTTLQRIFGTVMRGLCHVGLVRDENLEETFQYADKTLELAVRKCEAEIGSMYSIVYEIVRNKMDTLIDFSLENFQWMFKSPRDTPNAYAETIINYMRGTFAFLDPMDDGSRTGLHFSACGHVAERLVKLLTEPPDSKTGTGLPPIAKIDAFGLKNMHVDVLEFERFADSTGVPQLGECFNELKTLTSAMIDKDLPVLLQPGNEKERRKRYPLLSLDKIALILDKYVGIGLVRTFDICELDRVMLFVSHVLTLYF